MVSIILPVYNAYDDLLLCLESVAKHTNLEQNSLLLIDDKSSDERIFPYLEQFANGRPNVKVISNSENLGFVASVNKGFNSTNNDVILLNSDTIVTAGWLEKMQNAAETEPCIATVTPLSNNGSICSVPNFYRENDIPEGFTIDSFAGLVEHVSLRHFPTIPAGVGFCMYIKRAAIDDVGIFDEETFKKGYGEELDFCCRCTHAGYTHIMCDDTFIYHKGSASFTSEIKQANSNKAQRIVFRRYPDIIRQAEKYIFHNPDKVIQENIRFALAYNNMPAKRKNILFVSHYDILPDAQAHLGGVQTHVGDLIHNLADRYNFLLFARNENSVRLSIYYNDMCIVFEFDASSSIDYHRKTDLKVETIFSRILTTFSIDCIHIHQIMSLSDGILQLAIEHNSPIYLTLHDHFYLCPRLVLLDANFKVCSDKLDLERCGECLVKSRFSVNTQFILQWRQLYEALLSKCTALFAPSHSLCAIYERNMPSLQGKITVIEHGTTIGLPAIYPTAYTPQNELPAKGIFDYISYSPAGNIYLSGWMCLPADTHSDYEASIHIKFGQLDEVYPCTAKRRKANNPGDKNSKYWDIEALIPLPFGEKNNANISVVMNPTGGGAAFVMDKPHDIEIEPNLREKALNVGFLGGVTPGKGSKAILELVQKMEHDDVNFIIMGGVFDGALRDHHQDNILRAGIYKNSYVNRLLANYKIDVVCFLPLLEETFCYTLSEALQFGLPVIGTDVGAVGERIKAHGYGWVVPTVGTADATCELLRSFLHEPQKLADMKKTIKAMKLFTAAEMAEMYEPYYAKVAKHATTLPNVEAMKEAFKYTKLVKSCQKADEYVTTDTDQDATRDSGEKVMRIELEKAHAKLHIAKEELHAIHTAKSYRMLVKLNNLVGKLLRKRN